MMHGIEAIFVTDRTGFKLDYLQFVENNLFRNIASISGMEFCMEVQFGVSHIISNNEYQKLLQIAHFYRMVVQEFEKPNVEIGKEISEEDLDIYDQKVHHQDFPPLNPDSVRELAIDGNEKILMKLNPSYEI